MPLFGNLKYEDFLDIIENSETKIIGRINQVEARVEKIEEEIKKLEALEERLIELIDSMGGIRSMIQESPIMRRSRYPRSKNKRGLSRDAKILSFLSKARNTYQVAEHLGYSKTYASTLLNKMKKKGTVKVSHKVKNVPYYIAVK